MVRRMLTLLLLLCVLCGLTLPAYAITDPPPDIIVRSDNVTAYAGETVEVPIYVEFPEGASIAGISIVIRYPGDVLTLTKAKLGSKILSGSLPEPSSIPDDFVGAGLHDEQQKAYVVAACSANGDAYSQSAPLKLVTLTFAVNENAALGDYALEIARYGGRVTGTAYDANTYTCEGNQRYGVDIVSQPGAVTVANPIVPTAAGSAFDFVLHGTVESGDLLIAALYSGNGQMKDLTVKPAAAELSGVSFRKALAAGDYVKFMWVSGAWVPRCAMQRWEQS